MELYTISGEKAAKMTPGDATAEEDLLAFVVHDTCTLREKITAGGCALVDNHWVFGELLSTAAGLKRSQDLRFVDVTQDGVGSLVRALEAYDGDTLVKRQVSLSVKQGITATAPVPTTQGYVTPGDPEIDTDTFVLAGRTYVRYWARVPADREAAVLSNLAKNSSTKRALDDGWTEISLRDSPVTYRAKGADLFEVIRQHPIS